MSKLTFLIGFLIAAIGAEPNRPPYGAKIYPPEPYPPKHPQPYPEPAYKPPYPEPAYKPSYPEPAYKPSYPEPHYKPSYPEPHYKPSYPEPHYKHSSYPEPPYPHQPYKAPAYGPPNYKKDYGYCDPKKAPKCAANTTLTFCLTDYEYPEQEIKYAIEYDPLVLSKYAEVADQSADNLIDGLTALEEEAFDYSLYNGQQFDKGNWIGGEGYICPSEVLYARPVRAVNVKGEWRVIVQNVAYYTQTQRVETCLFPGAACRTLAPCYQSQCLQKYVYHRMLSFDPCDPYKGLFIDIYKLPSACSCHIPKF